MTTEPSAPPSYDSHFAGRMPEPSAPPPPPSYDSHFTTRMPEPPPEEKKTYLEVQPEDKKAVFTAYQDVIRRYEISEFFAAKLRILENYHIVYICDDSGSMNDVIVDEWTTATSKMKTRWDEAKSIIRQTVEIAKFMGKGGIDVYFLNRQHIYGVTDPAQLDIVFAPPPGGYTPLSQTMCQVLKDKAHILAEKKLLIIIVTDGEPTTDKGADDREGFLRVMTTLRTPPEKIPVSFILCTSDEGAVGYLNRLDKELKNVDVVDDFQTERKQILQIQDPGFKFSHGDYVVKCLLGSIDNDLDLLDEVNLSSKKTKKKKKGNDGGCVIL